MRQICLIYVLGKALDSPLMHRKWTYPMRANASFCPIPLKKRKRKKKVMTFGMA